MKVILIGILGLLIVLVSLFMIRNYEGFTTQTLLNVGTQPSGTLVSPSQESAVPNSQPGSVTNNPNTSLASVQDVIAIRDSIKLFLENVAKLNETDAMYNILDSPNTPNDKKSLLMYFIAQGDILLGGFNLMLSGGNITLTLQNASILRTTIDQLNDYILTTSNKQPTLGPATKATKAELASLVNLMEKYNNEFKKNKMNVFDQIQKDNSLTILKNMFISFVGSMDVLLKGLKMSNTGGRPITLTKTDYTEFSKMLEILDKYVKVDKTKVSDVVPNNQSVIPKTTKPTGQSASPTSLSNTQRPTLIQRGAGLQTNPLAGRTAIYTIAGPYLNKDDLQELINRIQAQRKKLVDLRSNAASIRARVDQLEKLAADVSALRVQLVRGTIKPEELPIEAESARMFLKNIESDPLPTLMIVKGETTKTGSDFAQAKEAKGGVATSSYGIPLDSNVQKLMESAKDLKWSIEASVMYDPSVAQREKLIERLSSVEKMLQKITVTGSEVSKNTITKIQTELASLTAALAKSSVGPYSGSMTGVTGDIRPELPVSTRIPTSSLGTSAYTPTKEELAKACDGLGCSVMANSGISPDVYSRPGMLMTDEAIKRRASGSQPIIDDNVSGLDYKQRTIDLCNQVKRSGLGDPKDFGCIADPSQVGSSYSWKGAYKMVCSRLGNTWGGFYPEMFGCGKYDAVSGFDGSGL